MVATARRPFTPAVLPRPLTNRQWAAAESVIKRMDPQVRGRKRIDSRRALDAIIYVKLTGCPWNLLPGQFPDDSSVHRTYQRWQRLGVLRAIVTALAAMERRDD